ncbi:MAG: methylated-DNA--[protein]-cysteine S-methyltransferase [Candidatus Peribacteraceae bacterium]|nr:methylated-DNA--[protein]-cysteine S-methyltransferase [Candidatus Peribacteraceae bacterium]MDD5074554.1 methylated-DNA--[protein]-cysteine S-methyltransferase [Candidatus Peribacteraceae bacterium]
MPPLSEATLSTPLGPLRLRAGDRGIAAVQFAGGPSRSGRSNVLLRRCATQMAEYFAGSRKVFRVPTELRGTPFQRAVWKALRHIPCGRTVTYGELARMAGHPRAARAVGSALRKNPLPVLLPCHRVVPASGGIGRYTGGSHRKKVLLELERSCH